MRKAERAGKTRAVDRPRDPPRPQISAEPPSSELAAKLLGSYFDELRRRLPGGFNPELALAAHEDELAEPNGAFLVARLEGSAVGCGALRKLEGTTAEVKHMWVDPKVRGRGVGKVLLEALEATARRLGCTKVRLDTSAHLPEALRLYSSSGYQETAPYNANPYAHHWFEKGLTSANLGTPGRTGGTGRNCEGQQPTDPKAKWAHRSVFNR